MLMVMENLKRKHRTILKVQDVKYNIAGIGDELFTKRNLENW
ncbi:outer membrane lipoprotein-sorting protein [Desulfothermus sp.]